MGVGVVVVVFSTTNLCSETAMILLCSRNVMFIWS